MIHEGDPTPHELRAALDAVRDRAGRFGTAVVYFAETASTNDVAARLASSARPRARWSWRRRRRRAAGGRGASGSRRPGRGSTSRS